MIKGLAITPPVIGRICIGKLVQKQDKWVPEKDDSFTVSIHRNSIDTGKMRRSSLDPTFLLA
ncbi:hypothetical protein ACV1C1_03385, partial [Aeromonas caviae]